MLFLQRLGTLERMGATEGPIKQQWETLFLDMIHRLCTTTFPPHVRFPASHNRSHLNQLHATSTWRPKHLKVALWAPQNTHGEAHSGYGFCFLRWCGRACVDAVLLGCCRTSS